MSIKRRKGVAIVHTNKGILVVSGRSKKFILPGGGANRNESRKSAAIRELHEETGLETREIEYLFEYVGNKWHNHKGKTVINHAKVFLVKTSGNPKPNHEIKYIAYWKPDSKIKITSGTEEVIKRYFSLLKAK